LALEILLLAALISFTEVRSGQAQLLLSLLSEISGIRNCLVFRLGLGLRSSLSYSLSGISNGFFFILLGNGSTGLLVRQFSVTILSTPAMGGLLRVFGNAGLAVTVTQSTTTAPTSATTATTTAIATVKVPRITRPPATVLVGTYSTVTEGLLVGVVRITLTSAVGGARASTTSSGSWSLGRGITLAGPCDGLVNRLRWRLRLAIRIEFGVVAE